MKLVIYHLYPDLLDLYGDRGNVLALAARCRWRGIEVDIRKVSLGDKLDLSESDILVLGGGSDREQNILVEDLSSRGSELKDAINDGLVLLTICGGYQLLGEYYQTADGKKIPGLGILDLYTVAGSKRLIGNVIIKTDSELLDEMYSNGKNDLNCYNEQPVHGLDTLVGFENHSGKTYLGSGLKPLGKALRGYGNNGEDKMEGVRYKNVFGSYLHGPVLPKNPHLTDLLIRLAIQRKGVETSGLKPLGDNLEIKAHKAIITRFGGDR